MPEDNLEEARTTTPSQAPTPDSQDSDLSIISESPASQANEPSLQTEDTTQTTAAQSAPLPAQANQAADLPQSPTFWAFAAQHLRTDPGARLCMSFVYSSWTYLDAHHRVDHVLLPYLHCPSYSVAHTVADICRCDIFGYMVTPDCEVRSAGTVERVCQRICHRDDNL